MPRRRCGLYAFIWKHPSIVCSRTECRERKVQKEATRNNSDNKVLVGSDRRSAAVSRSYEAAPTDQSAGSRDKHWKEQSSAVFRSALLGAGQIGWLETCVSFLVAALLWEFTAYYLIARPILFSPLGSIVQRAIELWREGELQYNIWVSFIEFAGGFGLAIVIGIGLGVAFAASRFMRNFFEPWVSMLYATPIIALGPLFILWLGIGVSSKIAIVFLTAVFPIL